MHREAINKSVDISSRTMECVSAMTGRPRHACFVLESFHPIRRFHFLFPTSTTAWSHPQPYLYPPDPAHTPSKLSLFCQCQEPHVQIHWCRFCVVPHLELLQPLFVVASIRQVSLFLMLWSHGQAKTHSLDHGIFPVKLLHIFIFHSLAGDIYSPAGIFISIGETGWTLYNHFRSKNIHPEKLVCLSGCFQIPPAAVAWHKGIW